MLDVLVVDDHQLVRETVARAIASEWSDARVDEAGDAEEFFDAIATHEYEMVILDIELGEHGGLELLASLRRDQPDVRAVVLTMHDGDHFLRRALALEADAFVSKSEPLDALLGAIESVANGESYLSNDLMRRALAMATGRSATVEAHLTERELAVLQLLADGARPAEIAASLYLSVKTVKNHLTRVYAKLGVETAAQAVAAAFRRDMVGTSHGVPQPGLDN